MGNKKTNIETALFFPPFPHPASLLHSQLYVLEAAQAGWQSMAATVRKYTAVPLCCSFLLMFLLCSTVGSSPWATFPSGNVHLPQHSVLRGLQRGYLLCQRAPPPPPHFIWPWCSLCCFSFFLFPPPLAVWSFLPFLACAFPEAPPPWLWVSAVPCSASTEADWNRLCLAWDSPGHSSQRPPCSTPLLPGPGHLHPKWGGRGVVSQKTPTQCQISSSTWF